jgi:hypothetical protein
MIPAVHSQRAKSNLIVNDIELEIEQEMSSEVSQRNHSRLDDLETNQ